MLGTKWGLWDLQTVAFWCCLHLTQLLGWLWLFSEWNKGMESWAPWVISLVVMEHHVRLLHREGSPPHPMNNFQLYVLCFALSTSKATGSCCIITPTNWALHSLSICSHRTWSPSTSPTRGVYGKTKAPLRQRYRSQLARCLGRGEERFAGRLRYQIFKRPGESYDTLTHVQMRFWWCQSGLWSRKAFLWFQS